MRTAWYQAVVNTGTGTPSSMATLMVQRPSPESETLPPNFASWASVASAVTVRSSIHEAMTLPRSLNFRGISQVELILVVLRIAKRRSLGIHLTLTVSGFQNAYTLGVSGHDPVFDAVMDHFNEVPGAVRSTMQVTLFSRAPEFLAARRAQHVADARRKRGKDRIQALNYLLITTSRHTVATLQAPDAAARPDIDIVNT